MSGRGNGRACVGPDTDDKTSTLYRKQNSVKNGTGEDDKTPRCTRTCSVKLPRRSELSPVRYLRRLGRKMAAVFQFVSLGTKNRRKVSGSVGRAKPMVAPIDSHRAEAINACIEFINSSSSLQRSNSVSVSPSAS